MSFIADEIILCLNDKNFSKGYPLCEDFIRQCEVEFMEQLTAKTATDFVASVLMFCELAKLEKKPWKGIPHLERISGALRFMEDFMTDSDVYASACYSVANAYAYAGFFPESVVYFRKTVEIAQEKKILTTAFSDLFFYLHRCEEEPSSELLKLAEKKLGKNISQEILSEAKAENQRMILTDPVEQTEQYRSIRYEIEKEVDMEPSKISLEKQSFCFVYWQLKKEILRNKYEIEWKTPAELNPDIQFQ